MKLSFENQNFISNSGTRVEKIFVNFSIRQQDKNSLMKILYKTKLTHFEIFFYNFIYNLSSSIFHSFQDRKFYFYIIQG